MKSNQILLLLRWFAAAKARLAARIRRREARARALTFAESMGFLFDDEDLGSVDAAQRWAEFVDGVAAEEAAVGAPPVADAPLLLSKFRFLAEIPADQLLSPPAPAAPAAARRGIAPFFSLPTSIPFVYVDASEASGLACVVFIDRRSSWSQRVLVPPQWAHSQQLCELFGYLVAFQIIYRNRIDEVILVGDNSGGLCTLYTLRTPSYNHPKLHLTQRVSRAIAKLPGFVHLRWCSTDNMLADCGSRNFVERIGIRIPSQCTLSDVDHSTLFQIPHSCLSLDSGLEPPSVSDPRL